MIQTGILSGQQATAQRQKRNLLLLFYCILISGIFLGLCSKSSFLYPLNDWGDANCFLTVGKSILHGKVPYRDIYDQKGPLLYLLHSAAGLVSSNSFIGVYLLELGFFSWFLWMAAQTARLFLPEAAVYTILPILSALILSSPAFCHGDSAEELCLPLVMTPLFFMVRYYKDEYPGIFPYRQILLGGICTGCIFLIKFNLLGFQFVWISSILLACLVRRDMHRALNVLLVFLGGIAAAVLPWIFYFMVNGALGDFFRSYLFNNIFLYSKISELSTLGRASGRWLHILTSFLENLQFSVPILFGLAFVLLTSGFRRSVLGRLSLLAGFAVLVAGVFAGDIAYKYYALILSAYSVLGLTAVFHLVYLHLPKPQKSSCAAVLVLASVAASLAFSLAVSSNIYLLGQSRANLIQYKFREIIMKTENPTLLNYGFLDFGEYTVCDIEPTCKYFCGLNIPLPEIRTTQDDIIRTKKVDYVITRNEPPAFILESYTVVSRGKQYYEGKSDTYFLLKKLP